uniref:Uncharacterized protein n=1 Tax=Oryza punctata TaxID=4537 RepID=A0A0E0LRQ1_ORYPU
MASTGLWVRKKNHQLDFFEVEIMDKLNGMQVVDGEAARRGGAPYPGSGNISPALQLAKLLHGHGVYITFVNTEHNHRRIVAAEGASAVLGRDGFRFETIPDGMVDADRDVGNYDLALSVATSNRCAVPPRELMARLDGAPPSRMACHW